MTLRSISPWEVAASLVILGALPAVVLWQALRKRPSPIEVETARRALLVQSGRIVDGTFLNEADVEADDGRKLTMLIFQYRIGGVDYTCSQDITELHGLIDLSQVRSGFPCSIRYERGNPQNSIVVAEQWSGLRGSQPQSPTPQPPAADDLESMDLSQLRPG